MLHKNIDIDQSLQSPKYGMSTFEVSPTIVDIKQIAEEAISIVKPRLQQYEIELINELSEVKVRHEKWREVFVTDEVCLHAIVSFFDRIRMKQTEAKIHEQVFTGEVTYLNGHRRTFAVGTTVGMCGLFGYVGGSLVAKAVIGVIVDNSGWDGCFILLLTGGILSTLFLFIVQRGHERKGKMAQ